MEWKRPASQPREDVRKSLEDVENGELAHFQVTLKVGFKLED